MREWIQWNLNKGAHSLIPYELHQSGFRVSQFRSFFASIAVTLRNGQDSSMAPRKVDYAVLASSVRALIYKVG